MAVCEAFILSIGHHIHQFFKFANSQTIQSHLTQLAFTSVSKIPNTRIMLMAIQYIPLLQIKYLKNES